MTSEKQEDTERGSARNKKETRLLTDIAISRRQTYKQERSRKHFNPSTPELDPSSQRCLP
jgi:hypothetical protein